MGSSGNYEVVGCYDSSDDKSAKITLTRIADVPEVDGATLHLSCFTLTKHLDLSPWEVKLLAKLGERCGVAKGKNNNNTN
jgi:hypothetical protein